MTLEPARHYFRNPLATAVTTAGRVIFTMPGEAAHQCADVDCNAASEIWEALATPISGADLIARTERGLQSVSQLVEFLVERTFVLRWTPEKLSSGSSDQKGTRERPCRHLVLGVTGAVQAVFVPRLVQRLSDYFAERVDVVLTASAQKFLQPRALAVLGVGVWSDPFESVETGQVPHNHLATTADLVLVLPATADAIFRLAHGACSDLLSLIVSSTRAPVVVVPSMNPAMWGHPTTQRNIHLLRGDGVFVVEPGPATSVADDVTHQVGGIGLGPDSANLIEALGIVLRLSR
jgi:phosphopantothenoylcysteine decarboxylase / phosphopantothenate---cysteine ligase